jgi:hypothetical protein
MLKVEATTTAPNSAAPAPAQQRKMKEGGKLVTKVTRVSHQKAVSRLSQSLLPQLPF